MQNHTQIKIALLGGSGFLGEVLTEYFHDRGDSVVVISRKRPSFQVTHLAWDGENIPEGGSLNSIDVWINLCGKSVNCRYTDKNRKEIIESRVGPTRALGRFLQTQDVKPLWINASSAAIYGDTGESIKVEGDEPADGFSPTVCKLWEEAFFEYSNIGCRQVAMRIGMVLSAKSGGVLQPFVNIVKSGLGGTFGSGKQHICWMHEVDFCLAIQHVIDTDMSGVIHFTTPSSTSNKHFLKALREELKVKIALPQPALFIKIGTMLMGTESELVLKGRRVKPDVLLDSGFTFKYPDIESTFKSLDL